MTSMNNGQIPPDIHGLKQRLSSVLGMMTMQTYFCEIEMIRISQLDPLGSAVESDAKQELRAALSEFSAEMHKMALKCEVSASVVEEYLLQRTVLSSDGHIEEAGPSDDSNLATSALETTMDVCFRSRDHDVMDFYLNIVEASASSEGAPSHSSSSTGSMHMGPKKMWMKRYEEECREAEKAKEQAALADNPPPRDEDNLAINEDSEALETEGEEGEAAHDMESPVLPPLSSVATSSEETVACEEVDGPYSTPEWKQEEHISTYKTTESASSGDSMEEQTDASVDRESEPMGLKMEEASPDVPQNGGVSDKTEAMLFAAGDYSLQLENSRAVGSPFQNEDSTPIEAAAEPVRPSPSARILDAISLPRRRHRDHILDGMLDEIPLPPPQHPVPYLVTEPDHDYMRHRNIAHHTEAPRVVELLSDEDERSLARIQSPPGPPPEDYAPHPYEEFLPRQTHHRGLSWDPRDLSQQQYMAHQPAATYPRMTGYPNANLHYFPYHPGPSTSYQMSYDQTYDHGQHFPYHTPSMYANYEYDPYYPTPHRFKKQEFRGRRSRRGDGDDRDKKRKRGRPDGKK